MDKELGQVGVGEVLLIAILVFVVLIYLKIA